jgi:hypothetical protein
MGWESPVVTDDEPGSDEIEMMERMTVGGTTLAGFGTRRGDGVA